MIKSILCVLFIAYLPSISSYFMNGGMNSSVRSIRMHDS
jgi:hypothetical protein